MGKIRRNRPPRLESLGTKSAFRVRRSLSRPHALHERRIRPASEEKHARRKKPQCLWSQPEMAWVSCSGSTMLIVRSGLSHLQALDLGLNDQIRTSGCHDFHLLILSTSIWPAECYWNLWWGLNLLSELQTG
jgi:hypothetical protein